MSSTSTAGNRTTRNTHQLPVGEQVVVGEEREVIFVLGKQVDGLLHGHVCCVEQHFNLVMDIVQI